MTPKSIRHWALAAMPIVVLFAGCASQPSLTYKNVELPVIRNVDPNKKISQAELHADLAQLVYTLDHAYSGRKFLPNNQFQKLKADLEKISEVTTALDLCKQITAAFAQVSDNHLSAWIKGIHCASELETQSTVGTNYFRADPSSKDKIWDVRMQRLPSARALLISILAFPPPQNPAWAGFLERVRKDLVKADLIIIDMRGNGGGSDSKASDLATILAGKELDTPYLSPQWTSNTPESRQLFINSFVLEKRGLIGEGKASPQYLDDLIAKFEKKRDLALVGKLSDQPFSDFFDKKNPAYEKALAPVSGYQPNRPIYILMDAKCGSSCESAIDFFEYNPMVKRVGEHTAGYIHFGNNGNMVLWNSGVTVQMAISFNRYKDGRFLEKRGITPNLVTPKGQDAMKTALTDFAQK